jgi:hypothetical protein
MHRLAPHFHDTAGYSKLSPMHSPRTQESTASDAPDAKARYTDDCTDQALQQGQPRSGLLTIAAAAHERHGKWGRLGSPWCILHTENCVASHSSISCCPCASHHRRLGSSSALASPCPACRSASADVECPVCRNANVDLHAPCAGAHAADLHARPACTLRVGDSPPPLLLERAQKAVVLIRLTSGWASGVIVDAQKGLILTNAHLFRPRQREDLPSQHVASACTAGEPALAMHRSHVQACVHLSLTQQRCGNNTSCKQGSQSSCQVWGQSMQLPLADCVSSAQNMF